LNQTEPPYTDPYVRWCGRESPRGLPYADFMEEARLTKKVRKQCGISAGRYLVPKGQIVTGNDRAEYAKTLDGTPVDPIFLVFLALGPFRIGGQ
jgi:hypothetical protein